MSAGLMLRVDELRAGDVLAGYGPVLEVRPRHGRWHITYRGATGLRMVLAKEPHEVFGDVVREADEAVALPTEPVVHRDADGFLSIEWPDPPRHTYEVAAAVLSLLVEERNQLLRANRELRDARELALAYAAGREAGDELEAAWQRYREARAKARP